jgi:hypothetical protein
VRPRRHGAEGHQEKNDDENGNHFVLRGVPCVLSRRTARGTVIRLGWRAKQRPASAGPRISSVARSRSRCGILLSHGHSTTRKATTPVVRCTATVRVGAKVTSASDHPRSCHGRLGYTHRGIATAYRSDLIFGVEGEDLSHALMCPGARSGTAPSKDAIFESLARNCSSRPPQHKRLRQQDRRPQDRTGMSSGGSIDTRLYRADVNFVQLRVMT